MKKSDVKYLVGALAIFLAIFLVLGFATSWFSNWKFSTWFNSWGKGKKESVQSEEVFAIDGDKTLAKGKEYRLPQTLLITADAVRGSSIIITAPKGETFNEKTEYDAVYFVNSDSEFAKGKRAGDFVEVCAVYDEAGVIVPEKRELKLKAPFGEQIMVQVSSTGEKTYSLCKLDYLKRLVCNDVSLAGRDDGEENALSIPFEYTAGTVVPDDIVLNSCYLKLRDEFSEQLKTDMSFDLEFITYQYKKTSKVAFGEDTIHISDERLLSYSMFITDFDVMTDNEKQAIYIAWNDVYREFRKNMGRLHLSFDYPNICVDYDIEVLYQGISVAKLTASDQLCGSLIGAARHAELEREE